MGRRQVMYSDNGGVHWRVQSIATNKLHEQNSVKEVSRRNREWCEQMDSFHAPLPSEQFLVSKSSVITRRCQGLMFKALQLQHSTRELRSHHKGSTVTPQGSYDHSTRATVNAEWQRLVIHEFVIRKESVPSLFGRGRISNIAIPSVLRSSR